jgi:alkylated DNA nucleotide flippase Atl1
MESDFFQAKKRKPSKSLIILKDNVFEFLKKIPKGRVVTYGIVARHCHVPNPRNVGWILQQNIDEKIPCYKVVGSLGKLTYGYKFGGKTWQKKHLEEEGIKFNEDDSIKDFKMKIWKI